MQYLKLLAILTGLAVLDAFAPALNCRHQRQTNSQESLCMFRKAARSTEEDIRKTRDVILKRLGNDSQGLICEKELEMSIAAEAGAEANTGHDDRELVTSNSNGGVDATRNTEGNQLNQKKSRWLFWRR
jgi:hypothetical protein